VEKAVKRHRKERSDAAISRWHSTIEIALLALAMTAIALFNTPFTMGRRDDMTHPIASYGAPPLLSKSCSPTVIEGIFRRDLPIIRFSNGRSVPDLLYVFLTWAIMKDAQRL
jgi:hypothetical protein